MLLNNDSVIIKGRIKAEERDWAFRGGGEVWQEKEESPRLLFREKLIKNKK